MLDHLGFLRLLDLCFWLRFRSCPTFGGTRRHLSLVVTAVTCVHHMNHSRDSLGVGHGVVLRHEFVITQELVRLAEPVRLMDVTT